LLQDFRHSTAAITSSPSRFLRSESNILEELNTHSTSADIAGMECMERAMQERWEQREVCNFVCQNSIRSEISSSGAEYWKSPSWSDWWTAPVCFAVTGSLLAV
jgi:hypothetical protein